MAKILVVDDELSVVEVLKSYLKRGNHIVSVSSDGIEALQMLRDEIFDLMITDIRLPGIDGIKLLDKAKSIQSQLAVIVMTAYAEVDTAVEAMKNGAFDYIAKPFKFEELMVTIDRALCYEKALAENKVLKSSLKTKHHFNHLVGDSEPMLRVYSLIEKVARSSSTILIFGESGTGKELVAKAIHETSSLADKPFVTVNCTAMPETLLESELFGYVKGAFTGAVGNKKGLFETANGGTIFLDEIGSIPMNMQMKLLRVLQEKEIRRVGSTESVSVDVRVIAATNENLEEKIKLGQFREDLYYRLSVIPIHLPPLREREGDIPLLTSHFLSIFEEENKRGVNISETAVEIFEGYTWPGNVRELENLVYRLATLCDNNRIEVEDLPHNVRNSVKTYTKNPKQVASGFDSAILPLKQYMKELEETYIERTVNKCSGNKEQAAQRLGISLATLYRKFTGEER